MGVADTISKVAKKRKEKTLKSMREAAVKESGSNVATIAAGVMGAGGDLGKLHAKRGPATRALQNVYGGESRRIRNASKGNP
jgi:hypothetical protein